MVALINTHTHTHIYKKNWTKESEAHAYYIQKEQKVTWVTLGDE